jgi:hypothetical protein
MPAVKRARPTDPQTHRTHDAANTASTAKRPSMSPADRMAAGKALRDAALLRLSQRRRERRFREGRRHCGWPREPQQRLCVRQSELRRCDAGARWAGVAWHWGLHRAEHDVSLRNRDRSRRLVAHWQPERLRVRDRRPLSGGIAARELGRQQYDDLPHRRHSGRPLQFPATGQSGHRTRGGRRGRRLHLFRSADWTRILGGDRRDIQSH